MDRFAHLAQRHDQGKERIDLLLLLLLLL
eukprot:COSAG02_NODE_53320_length_302_cov_1.211823_1_plen_28_part_10